MDAIDIGNFDMEDLDLFCSSVQRCFDDAFGADYFNLDVYDPTLDDSELPVDNDSLCQKRKRKSVAKELQQQYKLSRPRIVKSDFRRNFAQMWACVFNSTDFETMTSHIRCFYDDNVSVLQNDLRPRKFVACHFRPSCSALLRPPPFIPYNCATVENGSKARGPIIGHEYLSTLWYRSMQIAPDQVCTLKHTYVKVRSDGTSSIKCTFGLEGTKVVKVENEKAPPELEDVNLSVYNGHRRGCTSSPDDLDRFISSSSDTAPPTVGTADSSTTTYQPDCDSVLSLQTDPASEPSPSTDPLQEVLQRYLQASDAVSRSKAWAQAQEGRKRRRKRTPQTELAAVVAVEDWLSSSSKSSVDSDSTGSSVVDSPIQYATIVNNNAYIRPLTMCTLRGDNDKNVPIASKYKLQHGQKGEVTLTSPLQSTCSLELNFNADNRIVSVTINYIE